MPRLANERQELYCLHRAKGMVPKKAAMAAGYAAGSSVYSGLEEDADVMARISELTLDLQGRREQQRAAAIEAARTVGQITGMSKAWVLQQLAENVVAAREEGAFRESNDALELIGAEFGMFKGATGDANDPSKNHEIIDMDKTDALLNSAHDAMLPLLPTPPVERPMDMALVERLIGGKRKTVNLKDRQFSTGSETDVALTPESEPDAASEPEPDPNRDLDEV